MAVVHVELFALTGGGTTLADDDLFTVYAHLTDALATLATPDDVVVLNTDVQPYDTGAVVYLLGMADHAETITDLAAEQLNAAMTRAPDLFTGWQLMAGQSTVWCSDN